ncbi:HEPN domain-containing protein [bacterium A37T11]|nr:HEPN domain-containing protein [bacterium A37T11]
MVRETTSADPKNEQLHLINIRLTNAFHLDKLICISSQLKHVKTSSCFTPGPSGVSIKEQNSYCFLLIPSAEEKTSNLHIQQRTEEICKDIAIVTVLVHSIDEVNQALQNGSSFFTSIYQKGILLYDHAEQNFVEPGEGQSISKRIQKRERYWEKFHQLSIQFAMGARFYAEKELNTLAVFMLHQAVQHSYSGTLKVMTGYKSNSNSLTRLVRLIETALPDSTFVLSRQTAEENRLTNLLLKGFSDARYLDKFTVSQEEIQKLLNRVSHIIQEANSSCQDHLKQLKEGKIPYKK